MKEKIPMTPEEAGIISGAVASAECFGTGILTACKEALEDAGYKWSEEKYEPYIFENYIEA